MRPRLSRDCNFELFETKTFRDSGKTVETETFSKVLLISGVVKNNKIVLDDIAKLSPNFIFSWAEMVFNLNFALPNHPHPRESMEMAKRSQTK